MNTRVLKQKGFVFILVSILMVTLGTQNISYAQEGNPAITASVEEPLTEATLHGSIVTLTLSGGRFADRGWDIRRALSVLGIDSVTVDDVERVSDTEVTIELEFAGNIDSDATLTFTVEADAIAGYDENALTATLPVPAVKESLVASTETPLTEATLHGSTLTLTLTGRQFADEWDIGRAVLVSDIEGVAFERWDVERVSNTVATVPLTFSSNIDTDATLTLTVGAGAISGYDKTFTFQFPVTAVEESVEASTEAPLTEATLHGSTLTLTLTGRHFNEDEYDIGRALSVSGIEGVTFERWDVERVDDTMATVELEFSGNIDEDTPLTLTVGADAISGYDKAFTFQLPVTAVEESLTISTEAPLTEANLNGSTITLTLNGRRFADTFDIRDAVSVSGIDGATFDDFRDVDRVSDTEVTIELEFAGNIDSDATLTFTVRTDGILGYSGNALTATLLVPAVEESLEASTEAPLKETTLDGSTITLTLTGRRFVGWSDLEDAVSVSGIDGIDIGWRDQDIVVRSGNGVVRRTVVGVSDTEVTMALGFTGNIDTDVTLILTVGPDAIGYDEAFTFQFPVTAEEESLEASTEGLLTEANLNGSTVVLTLNGRQFADGFPDEWYREDAVSVSGIDGVTFDWWDDDVVRISDTEIAVKLEFDGTDFDTDATLTFNVGARVANYNQDLTARLPVTAIQQSNATVSIAPSPVVSPNVGEQLTLNLNIAGGENIAGYQVTVLFDDTALSLSDAINGDFLPADPFFLADGSFGRYSRIINLYGSDLSNTNRTEDFQEVTLTANTLAGASNGDGTLATLTFEIVDFKPSTVIPSQVYLVDADGKRWEATTESTEVTIPPEPAEAIFADINRDGVVNIQDLAIVGARLGQRGQNSADINEDGLVDVVDIVLVASAFDAAAAAPALYPQAVALMTAADVRQWLSQAQGLHLTDATFQRGIRFLEQLLTVLTPQETRLLPNYPNPFNPETWIPYQLAAPSDVSISIHAADGKLVRTLALGHLAAGIYQSRSRAAYWDGKNAFDEPVASGVYFYTITAGDFTATRKMLIRK